MYTAVFWKESALKPDRFESLSSIIKVRDRLISDRVVQSLVTEQALTSQDIAMLSDAAGSYLKRGVSLKIVSESLDVLRGRVLTQELLKSVAWRLAANVDALLSRQSVISLGEPLFEGWAAFKIDSVYRSYRRKDKETFQLDLLLLTGPGAGSFARVYLTRAALRYLAFSSIFVYRSDAYRFYDESLLTGMYAWGHFKPGNENLIISDFSESGALKAFNKRIFKGRSQDDRECDFKTDCILCGYGRDMCPYATRKQTLYRGNCVGCLGADMIIDPNLGQFCPKCIIEKEIV